MKNNNKELFPLIQSIVNKYPPHLQKDLFNDAIIIAYEAIDRWKEGSGNLKAFIYTTVYFRLRDEYKKYNSVNSIEELSTDRLMKLDVESKSELDAFYDKIEDSHRFILEKHYVDGYSETEIAKLYHGITGIATEQTVRRIINKYKKDGSL